MHETLLANRYAKALFDLAGDLKIHDKVRKDMDLMIELNNTSKDFRLMLKSPVLRPEKKIKILEAIFEGKVEKLSLKFFILIAKHRREPILSEIGIQYIELYKDYYNIYSTTITTPVKIDKDIRDRIIHLLEDRTKGGTIEITEKVDKDIIGGFIMNYKDLQYDASLRREINQLKKEFEVNLYVREI